MNYEEELKKLREVFLKKQREGVVKRVNDSEGIKRHGHEGNAEQWSKFVKKDTEDYCRVMSLREVEIQKKLREYTNTLPMGFMISCPLTQVIIQMFSGLVNAKKCLDIGVFTGSSALCMALHIPDDGKVIAMEYNEDISKVAKIFWKMAGVDEKVDLILGPANDSLDKILSDEKEFETFDFAFVDADKVNYIHYYEKGMKLLKKNGVMIFDNTLWKGYVYQDGHDDDPSAVALREFNKVLHRDERIEVIILPISDGVTILRKK